MTGRENVVTCVTCGTASSNDLAGRKQWVLSRVGHQCPGCSVRALSVQAPWAHLIATGVKTIELRSWRIFYRGPLVIHAGLKADRVTTHVLTPLLQAALDAPRGVVSCLVDLVDCRLATAHDILPACAFPRHSDYAWVLANPRPLAPLEVRGRQGVFPLDRMFVNVLKPKADKP